MFRRVQKTVSKTIVAGARFGTTVNTSAITDNVAARGMFCKDKVTSSVAEFFKLGFDPSYTASFDQKVLEEHVYGYLCAEAETAAGNPFHHCYQGEKNAFFFCENDHSAQQKVLKEIDEFIARRQDIIATHAVSVRSYHAVQKNALLFTVELCPFKNAEPAAEIAKCKSPKLEIVANEQFLQQRSEDAKARYQELLDRLHNGFSTSIYHVTESEGHHILSIAFKADRPSYFGTLSAVMNEISGITVTKKFLESFSNGVQIYTLYINGATSEQLTNKADIICQLPYRPTNAVTRLMNDNVVTAEETLFCNSMMVFSFYFTPPAESEDYTRLRAMVEKEAVGVTRLNAFRSSLTQEIRSERHFGNVVSENVDIVKAIFADFKAGSTAESREVIATKIRERCDKDVHTRSILLSFLRFNEAVVKHNFFKNNKAALAFRLDPKVFMGQLDFPSVPHGIFLFVGPMWRGFHVRFTDIARGGVRMIISDQRSYKNNKLTLFQENYNLAFTQLLKNKDIPEGGSKGTILVSTRIINKLDESDKVDIFRQYIDSLNDVILPGQSGVVDTLKQDEIIFLGPDENTAGHYPVTAALHAKDRGYSWWKSFTTGKDPVLGGIPHDTYGMTTRSVRMCVEGIYRKLGLDETKLTKLQTGGPDGDLGSNEILRSKEKIQAIVDGSGVLFDADGLNREELTRLAHERLMVKHFDQSKLSKKGFFVLADKKRDESGAAPIVLPDGTKVHKTVEFRDKFHFSPLLKCDVFVPCGGRPRSVTLDNVHLFLVNHPTATGEMMLRGLVGDVKPQDLKFKYIVEGANLFISADARLALERVGVTLIKDAAANKGGVTSSSFEVYTGLALTDAEHAKLMCNPKNEFYQALVADICTIIENNATREFELIWRESQANPSLSKSAIIDRLSRKIVDIRGFIIASTMFEDKPFVKYVLSQYTPKTLQTAVSVDEIMTRVPENYQRAICAVWLASNFVYNHGIQSNEFDFYQFMQEHRAKATQ